MKVLLVDDDLIHLTILKKIFEKSHDVVITARNGIEALRQLEFDPGFNVILTDIMMPEMDGVELLEHIRESDSTKNIPTIGFTSGDVEFFRNKAHNQFDELVAKPMDFFDLYTLAKSQARTTIN
ncbi:response regulator receiver domain-containing protein [Algoriphagus boseongensis]|uniref:Response regulator receiver domain-containing protein n=1 Tax=Algoriphagus boseongensis TaxID=1442587 RepID=A0A4R6T1Y1_9BACT|nr:response regulator [Algoriphagus boseongensis]TDQ14982.1 response regulator receiver domain-containing protein [Algoriphagus boseongensis]